ncbi:MAG: transcriptional repressor NrdR [Betaproteobacteria bacterium]|nr:MAG: transcriptional repressor NrdR [Betaproteobacteria bacterium]
MKCPFCGHAETQVVETRVSEDAASIRRRRRCMACEKRFTTFENAEMRMPTLVKQSGERQEFSRDKLREGFRRALHKRPVATEQVDAAIDHIVQRLLTLGEREISSRLVGEWVMAELKRLDKVAYIRFASVYRAFQDPDDFRAALREVDEPRTDVQRDVQH